jgi:dihydroorotate dehydrogenase (NAD+) catalytic subunit
MKYKEEVNSRLAVLNTQLAPEHTGGLLLRNPVIAASGTFGYGDEYIESVDMSGLGAVVCKGTTRSPREGNPQPRLIETASGLLNSIGLQNVGIDAVVEEKAPLWATWNVPVIVNIAGETVDEYQYVASRLAGIKGVSGIEINISCPNVASGGIEFGTSAKSAAEVTAAVKSASELPVIVKLSPNVTDITEIALAVQEAGADAITLINTLRGMAIDTNSQKPSLGNIVGGLSGPAIKPVALYMVYTVFEKVTIPIIGCGGITSSDDAIEFILAGASAVQVGTANLSDPWDALRIVAGINQYLEQKGIKQIGDLVGIAHV